MYICVSNWVPAIEFLCFNFISFPFLGVAIFQLHHKDLAIQIPFYDRLDSALFLVAMVAHPAGITDEEKNDAEEQMWKANSNFKYLAKESKSLQRREFVREITAEKTAQFLAGAEEAVQHFWLKVEYQHQG